MEAAPMVCYSMGAINSLIAKITLLMENHPMVKHLLQDINSLREDLNKFAGGQATGEQVKVWIKQAREMIYDIEDWIDLKQEAANFSEMDEKKIEQFIDQIKEARDRCERYELLKQAPANAEVVYAAPSKLADSNSFCDNKTVLVGTDAPKSKLLNYLKKEQKELKVVAIHGTGGIGKTTLAMEIYGDIHIKTQFECQAFVSVGRTKSVRTALIEILRQVKSEEDACQFRSCNQISTELWGYLLTKRYFICIDDIQCAEDSKFIFCALPDNNLGSRILTTTCLKDIAMACCSRPNDYVHEMIALEATDSKSLYCNSVCVKEKEWSDHFKECSNKMLEVCGGVPLAIILTAGLLGRRTSAEVSVQSSEELRKTILSEFDQFRSLSQVMRKILHISYDDLPLPVKSCFLYLAVFSGNCDIKKDRLIRRWIAEGLVPESLGKSSCETGESYFDELISRRLIQPVFDANEDQPIGCTVHGAVLDFMEFLSREENFVTAVAKLECLPFTCDRVRRVSLEFGDKEGDNLIWDTYCPLDQKSSAASSSDVRSSSDEDDEAVFLHLSRVRSLSFSGDAGRIPDLSAFKHLRVLDLEGTKGLENRQLESVGCLSQLRYFGICSTDVTKLPERIVQLEQLSTLDLRRTGVRNLPVFGNKNLISLLSDQLVLPRGMEGMQMLEEMSRVLVGPDGSTAHSMAGLVHGLNRLRMLGVRFSHLHGQNQTDRQGVKYLVEEVGKSNLQSLLLDNYNQPLLDILVDSLAANNNHLQKFELRIRGCLPQFPQEIASLTSLTHLHINVEVVGAQAVHALGKLPNLFLLKLCSNTIPSLTVIGRDGFQCLKVLWYNSQYGGGGGGVGFQFELGAMPQLRRLRLDLDAQGTTPNKQDSFGCFGIQHLLNLVHVHATIDWTKTTLTAPEVEAEEAHIREQVSRYPKSPVLELNRTRQRPAVAKASEKMVIAVHTLAEWSNQIVPNKLVVIHFTTTWCPASVLMAPVFADLAKRFWNVVFLEVDIQANDETKDIAQQFYVDGVPTFLFIKGGDDVDRVVGGGVKQKKELEDKLVALL